MFDVKRLIAEVAARNGMRLEPDDPAFVLIMLNELIIEDIAGSVGSHLDIQLASFEFALDNLERRAGAVLAAEVKAAATQIRAEIQKDIDAASIKAAHLVYLVDQAHKRPARLRSLVLALAISLVQAGICFYVGLSFRGH